MIARLRRRYGVAHEPLRSERRIELAVVILALLVLVQLLFLIGRFVATSQVRAVPPAPDSLAVVPRQPLETLTPQQSMEVLARPVFFASRRPREPLPETLEPGVGDEGEKKAGSLEGLKVFGIVENGAASRVIVSFKGKRQRLPVGETIGGWRLTEVNPSRVVLESGTERDERILSPMPVAAVSAPSAPVDDTGVGDAAAMNAPQARRAVKERRQEQQQQGRENAVRALRAGSGVMNRTPGNETQ